MQEIKCKMYIKFYTFWLILRVVKSKPLTQIYYQNRKHIPGNADIIS